MSRDDAISRSYILVMRDDGRCYFCNEYSRVVGVYNCFHPYYRMKICNGDLKNRPDWCPLIEEEIL